MISKSELLSRRGLLTRGTALATVIVAGDALNKLPGTVDRLFPQPSTINLVPGERLHPWTTSAVIGVPGQFVRNAENGMQALPILSRLGVRTYAQFGNTSMDVPGLKRGVLEKKKETKGNLNMLSWFCFSDGLEPVAQLIPELGNQFDTNYVFMDCSPTGLADAKGFIGAFSRFYKHIDNGDNELVTALSEVQVFKGQNFGSPADQLVEAFLDPYIFDDVASSALAEDQYQSLIHAAPVIRNFGNYVKIYNSSHEKPMKIVFLLPQNPQKDTIVDDLKALNTLNKIIPGIVAVPIGGKNQGHDNPIQNSRAYNIAINAIFAKYGI